MIRNDEDRVLVTQEQIFNGSRELRFSGLLKDGADPTALMVTISRVYAAMRRLEPQVFPTKELFVIGKK